MHGISLETLDLVRNILLLSILSDSDDFDLSECDEDDFRIKFCLDDLLSLDVFDLLAQMEEKGARFCCIFLTVLLLLLLLVLSEW